MKTVREFVPESTLEEFADRHGLVMRVVERSAETIAYWRGDCFRFYANFDGAEVGEGSILASASGNGNTEADAIRDYGVRISEKLLIVDAMKPTRREIRVPRIVGSR
jgi:hypothetical protein